MSSAVSFWVVMHLPKEGELEEKQGFVVKMSKFSSGHTELR